MLIDFHTHIFADKIAEKAISQLAAKCNLSPNYNGTAASLRSLMKKNDVDYSVVLPIASKPTQTNTINEWAKTENKDGFIVFGTLHPDNKNYKEIISNIKTLGLKGVKLHPDYQDFFAAEERMFPIYEEIFKNDLILILHCGVDIGMPPPVHCMPDQSEKLVKNFPNGKIVFSHLGGFRVWDEFFERLEQLNIKKKNFYVDTSMGTNYYTIEQFKKALSVFGEDRILFATDGPWSNIAEEKINMANMLKSIYGNDFENIKEKIFYKNAENLLKL